MLKIVTITETDQRNTWTVPEIMTEREINIVVPDLVVSNSGEQAQHQPVQ